MEELYMQPIQNNTTYPTVQQINEAQKQKPADNTDDKTPKNNKISLYKMNISLLTKRQNKQ